MATVRKALVYSSLARYGIRFIGLASTMVVSRLLTPDEIGTFAVASAIVLIMSEFRLLGAGGYLIREPEVNSDKVRSALGLTILVSWSLGLLIVAASYPVSLFYDLPPLLYIFLILSISFFFAPFVSIPISLLSRQLNFRSQMKVKFIGSLLGFLSTISLILMGLSFYSLAIGQIVVVISEAFMMLAIRPEMMDYRPAFRNIREVASFGVFNSLSNLLRKANSAIPDMVIGKMGTTSQVSMFSRGLGLIMFLSQTLTMGISPVILPFLSQTRQRGGNIGAAYTQASVMLGGIVVPVLGVVSVASLPTIRLFFGPQWDFAASLASWLAISAMFRCVHSFSNDLLITMGREKLMVVRDGLVFATLLAGIIWAQPHGLIAVAYIFVLSGIFEFVVTTCLLKLTLGLSVTSFMLVWSKNVGIAGICAITTWYIGQTVSFTSDDYFKPIALIALILPPIWMLSLFVVGHPLKMEIKRVLFRKT